MLSARENFYATPNNIRTQHKRRRKKISSTRLLLCQFHFHFYAILNIVGILCNRQKRNHQNIPTKSGDEADLVNFIQFATVVLGAIHGFCSSLLRNSVCFEIPLQFKKCNNHTATFRKKLYKRILPLSLSIPLFVLQILCMCAVHVA